MNDAGVPHPAPWRADRELDEPAVRRALRHQGPGLRVAKLRFLGSGWDYDAWLADEQWVFRFPRRRHVAEGIQEEIRGLALVGEALRHGPLAVPRLEHLGEPGPHFPYAFIGHRWLPGVAASAVPAQRIDRPQAARALGETLRLLHGIPVDRMLAAGMHRETRGQRDWLAGVGQERGAIEAGLPDEVRPAATAFLDGTAALAPEPCGPPRVIHNDLGADHVLLDPDSGQATALIDFGDLSIGDPAIDFAGLPAWLGGSFLGQVLRAYGPCEDPALEARIRFLARACSLVWLAEATSFVEHSRAGDLAKHRDWVRRSFDPES